VPIEEKVKVKAFMERVDFKRLNVLIISGDKVQLLTEKLLSFYDELPLIVTIEHQRRLVSEQSMDLFDIGYDEFSLRTLQRIASNFFICKLVEAIVYSSGRIRSEDITRLIGCSK
jgi:hypothetical protein